MVRKYFERFSGMVTGAPFEAYYLRVTRPDGPSREEARRDYESLLRDHTPLWNM